MTPTERVAVVTGAAQGIGRRTAEVLAERASSSADEGLDGVGEGFHTIGLGQHEVDAGGGG